MASIIEQGANAQAKHPNGTSTVYGQSLPQADPTKYTSLGDFIDEVNAPDIRASLVKTYGDQGITGFLKMTGAVNNAGTADEVTWWEEARLHQKVELTVTSDVAPTTSTITATQDRAILRKHDVVLWGGTARAVVIDVSAATIPVVKLVFLKALSAAPTAADKAVCAVVGSSFGQGTDQNDKFVESNVVKRTNPYIITKEIYKVSGSQATNIGYVDLGGGDYRWYIKGEMDTRQRFLDKREMMMLLGQKADSAASTAGLADATFGAGSEGYFDAINDRGIVTSDVIGQNTGFTDIDDIIKELDKNGAPAEYAMYCNTDQSLAIDTMLAAGIGTNVGGLAASFGAFNNSQDMAINLGFKTWSRGGYTFHKHDWRLLNDPNLLGITGAATGLVAGVMVPLATVADAKTGNKAPALEMNYKAANGYSRELNHWVTGGGVLGFNTDTKDVAQFNYRSETNLCVRAAEQHVLIKGVYDA